MRRPHFTVDVCEQTGTVFLSGDSDVPIEVCEIILENWYNAYGNTLIRNVIDDEFIHHVQGSLHSCINHLVDTGILFYFSTVQKWCWCSEPKTTSQNSDFSKGFPAIPERDRNDS